MHSYHRGSALAEIHKALEPQPDENITESHAGFHKILLEIANNRLLSRILDSVQNEMDQMVRAHQPEAARDAMLKHIDASWTDTLYEGMKER